MTTWFTKSFTVRMFEGHLKGLGLRKVCELKQVRKYLGIYSSLLYSYVYCTHMSNTITVKFNVVFSH